MNSVAPCNRAFARATMRPAASRGIRLVVRAEVEVGAKVQVKEPMSVYHVPGFKAGLEITDMVGEVAANVTEFEGVKLSPNYPWKVQYEVESKGKAKKFFVHLDSSELKVV